MIMIQVILVFGICGALRSAEATELEVNHVEDIRNRYLVSIVDNKNNYPGQFVIGSLFYSKINNYIKLRPSGEYSNRFFVHYEKGRCTRQNIGHHKIGEMPRIIAAYLNLQNPKRYTGHCFRRTAATLLCESGGNTQQLLQMGRWRSQVIAQGYTEHSMLNKELIFNHVVQQPRVVNQISTPNASILQPRVTFDINQPSTSTQNLSVNGNISIAKYVSKPRMSVEVPRVSNSTNVTSVDTEFQLNDADFNDVFTVDNITAAQGTFFYYNQSFSYLLDF